MVKITGVEKNSLADSKGLAAGDFLISLGGHPIEDVLDYRFYLQESPLDAAFLTAGGKYRLTRFRKQEDEDLGLCFGSYLMDEQRSCRNKCVFCFIDQLPKGLRKSLYFKDDDARLGFLFGNYITLTNLRERDVERMIEMHISPVNVSVHSMNPALRVEMMKNPAAGDCLEHLKRFARAGLRLNIQLVLCPGINDCEELRYSLAELKKLGGSVQSIAAVPVGLTAHREALPKLQPFTPKTARAVLQELDAFNKGLPAPLAFAADEFYLIAGEEIPELEHYGELHQLENGVGMWALFRDEFLGALAKNEKPAACELTVLTGEAAYPLISELCARVSSNIRVVAAKNRLFGGGVTVAGLLSGADIIAALKGKVRGSRVLIPACVFNRDGVTLDDMTADKIAAELGAELIAAAVDGAEFLRLLTKSKEEN
ncbi:MAG: DUF512 domain-containing protein [Clostridium sp.]|jgi:putative radical SAM enzyme (TIGR03279 family)|nr:DUF512 domain-containing protein [Clostridium sp.]